MAASGFSGCLFGFCINISNYGLEWNQNRAMMFYPGPGNFPSCTLLSVLHVRHISILCKCVIAVRFH